MGTITRTVTSTATKEMSTATYSCWNLSFVSETAGTSINVTVTGTKGGSYLNGMANTDPASSFSFSSGVYDADVANTVMAEMQSMLTPVTEE